MLYLRATEPVDDLGRGAVGIDFSNLQTHLGIGELSTTRVFTDLPRPAGHETLPETPEPVLPDGSVHPTVLIPLIRMRGLNIPATVAQEQERIAELARTPDALTLTLGGRALATLPSAPELHIPVAPSHCL
jgi:hypothetical protein